MPYDDLDLHLNGVQYLSGNALPRPLPRPVPRPLRPPYTGGLGSATTSAIPPLVLQQSKQFAYAPLPQRAYAAAPRIPLPYPPSFISFTTRRPNSASGYAASYGKPFRPSQPDPTPDLFAGRASKSLLDSYIPSWEVLRLQQQHQQQHQQQQQRHQQHQQPRAVQRHTLAYSVPGLRLFKRDSKLQQAASEHSRVVKKSLPQNAGKDTRLN